MKGIERRNGETDFAYKYRLIMGKATKVEPYYSLEWQDIVELLGIDQHRDTLRKRGDSWKELIEHADEIGLKDSDNEVLLEIKKERNKLNDLSIKMEEFEKFITNRALQVNKPKEAKPKLEKTVKVAKAPKLSKEDSKILLDQFKDVLKNLNGDIANFDTKISEVRAQILEMLNKSKD